MERTYKALIEASHEMAKSKGWWEGGIENRSLDDQFNNFHAEVSEGWEEYRAGRMATWYAGDGAVCWPTPQEGYSPKPEGFWVEIADLLIRMADTCGAYGIETDEQCSEAIDDVPAFVATLHHCIDSLRAAWSFSARGQASSIFAGCFITATFHGVDLWAVIDEKMAYNATRSHRHGGKKA